MLSLWKQKTGHPTRNLWNLIPDDTSAVRLRCFLWVISMRPCAYRSHPCRSLHRKGDGLAGLLLCVLVEQRQIMLRGRRALVRVVAEGEIVDQGGVIAREQAVAHVLGKPLRPVESGTASTPVQAPQIVHDVAAADDEHALVAKRRQPPRQC